MIIYFFIAFSYLALFLNLNAPKDLSNASQISLFLEHTGVLFVAWVIIRSVLRDTSIKVRNRFFTFFVVGYLISLLYLHFYWTPYLSPVGNPFWGFDPQRYYYYASSIAWGHLVVYSLNYQGVVYTYVYLFKIFGIDPLVPLFFNVLLALYATTLIAKTICKNRPKWLFNFALLFLLPDVVYYNAMSAREILNMSFMTIFICKYISFSTDRHWSDIYFMAVSFALLAFIRPPMAMFALLVIGVQMVIRSRQRHKNIIIIVIIGVVFSFSQDLSDFFGSSSSSDELVENLYDKVAGENEEGGLRYSANSMTARLIPHNPVEFFVFGFIRSFFYVIPSPGMILSPIKSLSFVRSHGPFENISTWLIFFSLYFLIKFILRYREHDYIIKTFILTFLIYFFGVATSLTNFIQMRYRVVYDLFLFSLIIYIYCDMQFNVKKKRSPLLDKKGNRFMAHSDFSN